MAIKKSFGGASIRKAGAYSRTKVDNSGGAPLESNDALFIVGEAKLGKPGADDGIQEFSASQVSSLVEKYGSGPIVDCVLAATRPASTPGIQGAGKFYIYKTNASTQAALSVNEATDTNELMVIKDIAFGQPGNNIAVTIANGTNALTQKLITISKSGEVTEVLPQNEGQAQFSLIYTGDATTAVANITGLTKSAKVLSVTLAGDQTDGTLDFSINLQNLSIKELADQISAKAGFTCVLLNTAKGTITKATDLDLVAALDITAVKSFYRLQEEIVAIINANSIYCEAVLNAVPKAGLPVNVAATFLTGGAQGASSNSSFSAGMSKSLSKDYNVILPAISQDAADDIALGSTFDGDFVTDSASAYTIASVQAAMKSHLLLRGQIKTRKEAQGFTGIRAIDKADAYAASTSLVCAEIQMCMQDVRIVDVFGELRWKQPHVLAALAAGVRLGTSVGEPLTHKFINANDVGHFIDMAAGDSSEKGDFDPNTDYDITIDNGILYVEKVAGGWRFAVDNTTYGADQSFVWNRGSVVEAAQYVAKTLRQTAELVFIGTKVSNGMAHSIKNVLRNKLIELNAPDVNVITSSEGAPQGFVEESFVVTVTGNTAEVQVEIKPCQGLDFLFITFQLGDIKQSA